MKHRAWSLALSLTLAFAGGLALPSSDAQGADPVAKQAARDAISDITRQINEAFYDYVVYESITDSKCELILKKSQLSTTKSYTIDVWSTKTARPYGSSVKVVCLDSECIRQHQSVTYPTLSIKSFRVESYAKAQEIAPLIDQMRMECANYRNN